PDHWIANVAAKLNIPLVTTSVNISGSAPMKHLGELQPEIGKSIAFCIDEGLIMGKVSKVIDCTAGACIVQERQLQH
ncbi:Sua5/YciO/YrdC/YwlC family protein, partial [Candidatus Woesearchaeota archaeon]|nr:Sua5/YciO/YrdC/YwlC family protein [Candidatus Woesearchaeota archaeon]